MSTHTDQRLNFQIAIDPAVAVSPLTSKAHFGVNAVQPSMQVNLKNVAPPPKIDEVKPEQNGPKAKLPAISGQATGEERISRAGDAVRHQGGGSWLSDAVNMGLKAMERTPEVKQELANVPAAPDPAILAQQMKLAENTQYTKAAENNFDMKPSGPSMVG